jgi:Co/Zn/Cd efflux system component
MSNDHAQQRSNIRRVQLALALTGTFMLVEVAGGILWRYLRSPSA